MEKLLLLGAEAIAQGAIDGGMSGIYAYPGTPSTEITEYIQELQKDFMKVKVSEIPTDKFHEETKRLRDLMR